jgi:hypothetical protein
LRIWRDSSIGRIGGYNNNVLQWYAGTDGKLAAGGGNTILDADGVNLIADTTATETSHVNSKAITFERSTGELVGRVTSYYLSGSDTYGLHAYSISPTDEISIATFGAFQAGVAYSPGAAGAPRIIATADAMGAGDKLSLYGQDINFVTTDGVQTGTFTPDKFMVFQIEGVDYKFPCRLV